MFARQWESPHQHTANFVRQTFCNYNTISGHFALRFLYSNTKHILNNEEFIGAKCDACSMFDFTSLSKSCGCLMSESISMSKLYKCSIFSLTSMTRTC